MATIGRTSPVLFCGQLYYDLEGWLLHWYFSPRLSLPKFLTSMIIRRLRLFQKSRLEGSTGRSWNSSWRSIGNLHWVPGFLRMMVERVCIQLGHCHFKARSFRLVSWTKMMAATLQGLGSDPLLSISWNAKINRFLLLLFYDHWLCCAHQWNLHDLSIYDSLCTYDLHPSHGI